MKKKSWNLLPWILFFLLGISMLAALNCGYSKISYGEVLISLLHPGEGEYSLVLFRIRLPRIVLSVLCGMGLALSGCALQAVTQNTLADSGILGINAGAGFMVMIFLSFFPALHVNTMIYQPLFALLGGVLAAALLYVFSHKNGKVNPGHLLLGGIGIAAGFSSLMMIVGADMENSSFQSTARWMAGNIWGTSWEQVKTLFPYVLILIPFLMTKAKVMDIFFLGEEVACGLGVKVEKERRLLLFIAVGLAASCISVSGGIGFIGLVSPHIARKIVGPGHRKLLPTTMLMGGILLLWADTLGRSLFPSIEIPAGIVISIVSAPYFLYLLKKQF